MLTTHAYLAKNLTQAMFALIPDQGALSRHQAAFGRMTRDLIIANAKKTYDGRLSIDIVGDVINAACTRWVSETLVSSLLPFLLSISR